MPNAKVFLGLALCGLIVAAMFGLAVLSGSSQRPVAHNDPPTPSDPRGGEQQTQAGAEADVKDLYLGRNGRLRNKKINTVLTTRKGDTVYQTLVRYEPQTAPLEEAPGWMELLEVLAQHGRQLPTRLLRVDEETEMLSRNLGQLVRSVTSYHAYVAGRQVVAFDLARSSGGQPERYVGHLSKRGVQLNIYRSGELIDKREITLPAGTFIPLEMEFIHDCFLDNREALQKREKLPFSIFLPGFSGSVTLLARPLEDRRISIKDATYECAGYEVQAMSSQAAENSAARQEFWFDKRTGFLMKREDYDASLKPGEAPVTERVPVQQVEQYLSQVRPANIDAPTLPARPFPYPLDKDLTYTVRAREAEIGQVHLSFRPSPASSTAPYVCDARVHLDVGGSVRHEVARTYYDDQWRARVYDAQGDETADVRASYKVHAKNNAGVLDVRLERNLISSTVPTLEALRAPTPAPSQEWDCPIKAVAPLEDEQAGEKSGPDPARLTKYSLSRPLSEGTYLYDFNRVEHVAAFAFRLPLPQATDLQSLYQNVALYSVRQNRCGLVLFEIKPEPRPALSKAQQRWLGLSHQDEPQLYIVTATLSLLPCKMLLTQQGRLLELTVKYGSGDVTYTLDDPIMQRRLDRARKQKIQQGPQLIRPPWWQSPVKGP